MAAPQWTLEQVIAQLRSSSQWTTSTITYSFPTSASGLYGDEERQGFRPVEPAQQSLVTLAVQTWDDLIPQAMVPGTPGLTSIEFGYTNTGIGFAHAYFPQTGSTWFNSTKTLLTQPTIGAYGYLTFVHEIGHALGLNHMGDYNGNGNWSPSSYQDSIVLSVMSYFGPRGAAALHSPDIALADWTDAGGTIHVPQTPMVNDVLAIQAMYGVSGTTRTESTVYGFGSTVGGAVSRLFDFTVNRNPIVTLFDSGGIDTLDLSGWSTPSVIDLRPGAYSSANAMTNNIAIAYSTVIENAVGGPGDDVLVGNGAANLLVGGSGNDELQGADGDDVLQPGGGRDSVDGGNGSDRVVLALPFASYTVNVNGATVVLSGGGNVTSVTGVERFVFADGERALEELTRGDVVAPRAVAFTPADDASGVPAGTNLVIEFDEAVKAGAAGTVRIVAANGTVSAEIALNDTSRVSFDGRRVVIDPPGALASGAYSVLVSAGAITDMAGNPFAGVVSATAWNFAVATADTIGPRLVDFTPDDETTGIAPGARLVLVFDEPLTVGAGAITLRDASGTVVRTFAVTDTTQVQVSGSVVTVTPAAALPASTRLTVTVDAGAFRDAAGNAFAGLASTSAWNFTTQAAAGADDFPFRTDTTGVVVVGGAPAAGHIETVDDLDLFRVDLTAGQSYVFSLQRSVGGLPDPLLWLYGPLPDLDLLATDDDGGVGGNSRLLFTAPTTGTYYLTALDYGSGTGRYTLAATLVDIVAPTLRTVTPADNATGVAIGTSLVLNFSEPVQAGSGFIRLVGTSGALLLEIRASDTNLVRIVGSTVTLDPTNNLLPATGYAVQIDANAFRDLAGNPYAGLSGTTAWNFTTAAPSQADDFPMRVDTPGQVFPGGVAVPGRIETSADGDLFRVNLVAGTTYRFEMNAPASSPVDPYLVLYGVLPEAELITFDDDSGGNFNARFFYTPTINGTYYLAAFDYAEATGSYSVQVQIPSDDFLGSLATTGRLTVGAAARSAQIGVPTDVDAFGISVVAGQQYTVDLMRTEFNGLEDPYLALFDPQGRAIGFNDDSGGDLNARLTFTAATTDTYFVQASDYFLGTGAYTIRVVQRTVIDGTVGTGGPDTLRGTAASEKFFPGAGDDLILGEGGIDTAVYLGASSRYIIEGVEDGWLLVDTTNAEGRDNLDGVERLLFGDGTNWAIDMDGNAGVTVLVLSAVFGIYDDTVPGYEDYVGIGLWALDQGITAEDLVDIALEAALGAQPANADVVRLLFRNVVGVEAPPSEFAYFKSLLDTGVYTQGELGVLAAEHPFNLENVDFVGLAGYGVPFVPFGG